MKIIIIVLIIISILLLLTGNVIGELTEDKCSEIKDCIDFLWYKVASECTYSNIEINSDKCKEIIKGKYPENYSKLENCYTIIRSYGKEYADKCSFIDNLQNNISKEECEKSLKHAQENERSSPEGYWIEYVWTGKVCGRMGMCDLSYEAYKKVIDFESSSQEAEIYSLEIIKCYDIWYDDSNKVKKIYKEFADTVYEFGECPRFKYEKAANLYVVAEDYKNACKSCQEANTYYVQNNISTIDCKQYGCNITKQSKILNENSEQPDYNFISAIAIILITILLSAFIIRYKKFKK